MKSPNRIRKRIQLAAYGVFLLIVIVAAITFSAAVARQVPEDLDPPELRALSVDTIKAFAQAQYSMIETFVGRAEAARSSHLGFELNGLITRVLVNEGQRIEPGDTIATLDQRRLSARRTELTAVENQIKAEASLARRTYDRIKAIVHEDVVSRQRYDEAKYQLDAQQAALQKVRAQIEQIEIELQKSILKAPFAGVVTRRMVDEGKVIQVGEAVIELLEMDRMEIRVGVNPSAAQHLKPNTVMSAKVQGQSIPATLRTMLPKRNPQTRTVTLLLTVSDNAPGLRHGDLVEITIRRSIMVDGFWLPKSSLTESVRGLWACYIAAPVEPSLDPSSDKALLHTVEKRELELLHQDNDRVYVRGTLKDGERVIAAGLHRLVPGQRIILRS